MFLPAVQPTLRDVFREELAGAKWASRLDFDHLVAGESAITVISAGREQFADALWDSCFPSQPDGIYAHHTDLKSFHQIVNSRELWLFPVAKQVKWSEMELFANQFDLDGYLATGQQGARVLDELARVMFSLSLTSGDPSEHLWGPRFGPLRLLFEVKPILQRSELRRIAYAPTTAPSDHPFLMLRDVALRRFGKLFVPPRVNRAGAFYLPSKFAAQEEVRLLIKRLPGSPAINTKMVGNQEVLPIPLDGTHERVSIRLREVQTVREDLVENAERILAQVPDWGVTVKLYTK